MAETVLLESMPFGYGRLNTASSFGVLAPSEPGVP